MQKLEPESASTAESVGGIDGGQAYTQLLASVKAAPNKVALEALVQAIKVCPHRWFQCRAVFGGWDVQLTGSFAHLQISMEAKEISDNETVRLRTAYTERAVEIVSELSRTQQCETPLPELFLKNPPSSGGIK